MGNSMNNLILMQEKKNRQNRAYELWKNGANATEISKIMGVRLQTVTAYLREYPDYVNRKRVKYTLEELQVMFDEGKTDMEIVKITGLRQTTVNTYRHRLHRENAVLQSERSKNKTEYPDGFDWKWPIVCNMILIGKKQNVPAHDKDQERKWLAHGAKRVQKRHSWI